MTNTNQTFEEGDRIKIVYKISENAESEDIGVIKSKPSEKFDWPDDNFDFDYELKNGNTICSVDIDGEQVGQLHYEAGGDRDWDAWELVSIEQIE